MRRRLRTLATALDQLRTAVDPRTKPDAPALSAPPKPTSRRQVEVPEFDDPGQLTVAELQDLRRELADELQRAAFTSDPKDR